MTKKELHGKALKLPKLPGVYLIQDKHGTIIYIGKAKNLFSRVGQYFRAGVPHDQKTERMIESASDFDTIVTGSEYEALVLECSQIKQHQPKYNILLKDDKGYSYIKVTRGDWPRITAELQKGEDEAEYIGPYLSSFAVKQMVQTVLDSFLLPRCTRRFPQDFGKARPCLYSHIGKCMAVCTGKIPQEDYAEAVENALQMVRNGQGEIVSLLQRRMEEAAENLEFERAALLRNQIRAIKKVNAGQTVVKEGEKNQDVIAFANSPKAVCAAILRFREGALADKKEYLFYEAESIDIVREQFLAQYYLDEGEEIPKSIAVDAPLPGQDLLQRLLSEQKGAKVRLYTPERGDNKRLIEMAYVNAMERLAQESGRTSREEKILDELAGLLGLPVPPTVIESYDISNWGEGTSVCGMVVFENGKPKKAGYRRFKINSVEGTDDYASMAEALLRRAAEYDAGAKGQFGVRPDLILLDGGLGQVGAGAKSLADTGLGDVPVYGMVKDDRHRTRAIVSADGKQIELALHRSIFSFVTRIQDEVHRFAIDYQRRRAKGKTFASTLTQIKGVGPETAKTLMRQFKTMKAIAAAEQAQLAAVKGVNKNAAKAVWEHYHKGETPARQETPGKLEQGQ
ncbi:excinuclease ABC subunit UvrC [Ruminococcaceae bacterium OttesenSCG-928-I18]|nr:excinuclease ABC subunit UvrC [Ruminococcaceae bacterium OttesenSCG-928-I18]